MTFLWIEMLWLLLLVPVLVAAYVYIQRRRQKYALRYASLSLVREAIGRGPGIRRHIPPAIFLLGLTVIIVALARPVATVILPSQRSTVILTIDVSGSMLADDLKPNRMTAAKAAAKAFVENQPPHVRIGVVSFANHASVVQAPTTDRQEVLSAIDRLQTQRSTAIGSGVLTSLEAIFEEPIAQPTPASRQLGAAPGARPTPTPVPRGTYVPAAIVLLSDGQSNTGPRPLEVIRQAADRGVRVYTVGVGSPQGTVLRMEGRSMRVRLDEETLQRMADETGASYFRADSETDLQAIYENLSTGLVMKAEQQELTAEFTGAAAVLLLISSAFSLLWFHRLP